MSPKALNNLKVLEFTREVSGPYCGKLFADLGAEVIKVEPPEGDASRYYGPFPDNTAHTEKSALFLYLNTNKKGVTLDLDKDNERKRFGELIQWADILIDNHSPEVLEKNELGWEQLHCLNPGLIYVSITPYGRTGPRAKVMGDELTVSHGSALANLLPARSVDITLPPVKLGGYFAGYQGGLTAALAGLALFIGRQESGTGRMVDISLEEVLLSLVSPVVANTRYHGTTWSRVPDRPPAMGRMETSDGYVVLGAMDDHHFRAVRELMGKPEWAASDHWDDRRFRMNHLMDIAPMMDAWMRQQKKDDIHHRAARAKIPIGPFNTAADLMANEQYKARGYFIEIEHPVAGKYTYPGWPYRMTASPPGIERPAPLLGQHNKDLFESNINFPKKTTPAGNHTSLPESSYLPLEGIRVLDFCWVWAGPYGGRALAELGAEVIKIEGHKRSDLTRRLVVWPLPDPIPTDVRPNQGLGYITVNLNKKSLTLDLSKPEGLRIARQLTAQSDLVIDNMRPGAMEKLGLGYEELKKVRKDIIVATLSSRGYGGPHTDYLGFAPIHQAVGGVAYISGHPESHPTHGTPGDADLMNGFTLAYACLAALNHRSQTGEGQFIDFSQCEGVSSLIGETLLGYTMTGRIQERMGNRHPLYCPHNVYRCWGVDRWLALEIHSDREFSILAQIISRPDLAKDSRFVDQTSRKRNEDELDRIIESWTSQRDRDWMVNEFSQADLAASPSREARDVYADSHFRQRNAFLSIEHPEIGHLEIIDTPWKISGLEKPHRHAPLLGEHNDYVLKELLGMSDEEVKVLQEKEVIMGESGPEFYLD
ncbi:MAG: CoA transferase [Deltaproteobacteria bacterium]|nr:CoA transferase [Deltaproteobacteria bacterium]